MPTKKESVESEVSVTPEPGVSISKPDQAEALRASYAAATKDLRAKYPEDFNVFRAAHMTDAGFPDWKPALSPLERRKAEIDRLIAEAGLQGEYGQLGNGLDYDAALG